MKGLNIRISSRSHKKAGEKSKKGITECAFVMPDINAINSQATEQPLVF